MAQSETRDAIAQSARILGLAVPEACLDGVAANLALLRTHFAVVAAVSAEKDPAK